METLHLKSPPNFRSVLNKYRGDEQTTPGTRSYRADCRLFAQLFPVCVCGGGGGDWVKRKGETFFETVGGRGEEMEEKRG